MALVGCFKSSCGVDCGVGARGVADGLRRIGVVVEVEVARRVDARLPVGQGEVEGLALGDVSQDLTK